MSEADPEPISSLLAEALLLQHVIDVRAPADLDVVADPVWLPLSPGYG
ncbi:hypothetical protein LWP59_16110 [Amycolatopsis acidiphila]|nr:hypothetical protein [Amycolatopsis acidiphila]UIJ63041.1 hypothetical protein LWP59_16110 [Amycolatopsis acidiphila]GHG65796.1 hypothetical protein GCM10017788_23540 [Amycolatopsis acidiphila]